MGGNKLLVITIAVIFLIEIARAADFNAQREKEIAPIRDSGKSKKGKQPVVEGIFSPKGIIGRYWIRVKRLFAPVERFFDSIHDKIINLFDGKRSFTWTIFGRRLRIVMPRIPRSWKDFKLKMQRTYLSLKKRPLERCLIAIYINILVFVFGYAILFLININHFLRFRRAKAAAYDGKPIFDANRNVQTYSMPKNMDGTIKKITKHMREEMTSPTGTVLEEDREVARTSNEPFNIPSPLNASIDLRKYSNKLKNEHHVMNLEQQILTSTPRDASKPPGHQQPDGSWISENKNFDDSITEAASGSLPEQGEQQILKRHSSGIRDESYDDRIFTDEDYTDEHTLQGTTEGVESHARNVNDVQFISDTVNSTISDSGSRNQPSGISRLFSDSSTSPPPTERSQSRLHSHILQ